MKMPSNSLDAKAEEIKVIRDKYSPKNKYSLLERVKHLDDEYYDNRDTFSNALKDFYDLRSGHRTGIRTHIEVLVTSKEDNSKIGQIPEDLISDLEEIGQNKVVGSIVPKIEDLSYEKVRESIYLKINPPVSRYWKVRRYAENFVALSGIGILSLTMGSTIGFGLDVMPDFMDNLLPKLFENPPIAAGLSIILSGPVLMAGAMRSRFKTWKAEAEAADSVPKEIKNKRYAIESLYSNAKIADGYFK